MNEVVKSLDLIISEVTLKKVDTTAESVASFLRTDDISRMAPGQRDYVFVREGKVKIKKQKRHMLMSLKEAHSLFRNEGHGTCGLTRFCEYRPVDVCLSRDLPLNVCCCKIHEDFIRYA